MTTNARDEKWSEWIEWSGGSAPLAPTAFVEVKTRDGDIEDGEAVAFYWMHDREPSDIIAYRYKIKEPESDMHPDLEWLARNVSEWTYHGNLTMIRRSRIGLEFYDPELNLYGDGFSCDEWLQARKDLGLIMSDEEEEIPAPEWAGSITDSWEEAEIVRRLANQESIRTTIGTLRSKYHVVIKGVQVDVYDVLHGFGVTNPADAHAIKKMLKAGQRGYKDANQDRQEAIDSIKRAMELEDEM